MKKYISAAILIIISVTSFWTLVPDFAVAQGNIPVSEQVKKPICGQGGVDLPGCNNAQVNNFTSPQANWFTSSLIPSIITNMIAFIGIASVGMIIYAGIQYLISGGSEENPKKANKIMTYAITGLVISMLSYIIIQIIISLNFN